MYDGERIDGKTMSFGVPVPEGTPFHIHFVDGVAGHFPEKKSSDSKPKKWVKGVPAEVAESRTAGEWAKQGIQFRKRGKK